jgi:hypothetical protein
MSVRIRILCFEPPGYGSGSINQMYFSGSISQRYGSGSFNQQATIVRKTLISTVFLTSYYINYINMYRYLQKVISRKNFFLLVFVCILKVNDENGRIRIRIRIIRQRHGSADPDPDPYQNVMDSQHCCSSPLKFLSIPERQAITGIQGVSSSL